MWLGRRQGLGRVIRWILVFFLGFLFAIDAAGQDVAPCTPEINGCDQGQAYQHASADASVEGYCTSAGTWAMVSHEVYADGENRYGVEVRCRNNENFETGFRNARRWYFGQSCSARPH